MTLSNISFLGKSLIQTNNLKSLNTNLVDLQRQLATQKKFDNFADIGPDSKRVQRLRADTNSAEVFMKGIDNSKIKINLMSDAMLEITKLAKEVADSIVIQTREGDVEIDAINTVAKGNLSFLDDLLNTDFNGDFLFSGTDVSNEPFASAPTLNTNFQNEISTWLNGTQSAASLISNIQGISGTDLGYSSSLPTAEDVRVRIDTSIEINYSVHADQAGLPDILRGISLAANLKFPDPAVDTGTEADFHQILNEISDLISKGVKELDSANFSLSSQVSLMDNIYERHRNDQNTFEGLVADIEDADSVDIITQIQSLQTQLTASYQASSVIQQLSLVNFI